MVAVLMFNSPVDLDELSEQRDRVRALTTESTSLEEIQEAVKIRQKIEDELLSGSDDTPLLISIAAEPHLAELGAMRLGSTMYWGMPSESQKTFARELLERSNRIATKAWTNSLANDRESRALRSSAAGLRAVAMLGLLRLDASDRWTDSNTIEDISQLFEESLQLARGPRGVIFQAAAITAATKGNIEHAQELLNQARSEPTGLDPLVMMLIETSIETGGIHAHQRVKAAERLFSIKLSPAERLFLMQWRARAGYESGEPRDKTLNAISSRLDALPANERRILIRPVSEILVSIPGEAGDHPLENFGRARAHVGSNALSTAAELFRSVGENSTQNHYRAEAWLELAQLELSEKNRDAAVECLVRAITSEPDHPSSQKAAQLALRISSQLGTEIRTTQSLVNVLPNHPDRNAWRMAIAKDAFDNDRLQEALTMWEGIPTVAPESTEARIRIIETKLNGAKEWSRSGDELFKAIDLLDESLETHPDESEMILSRSLRIEALIATNRLREAARIADDLPKIEDIPSDVRYRAVSALIKAFSQADRKEDAARVLDEFGSIDSAGRIRFANAYLKDLATSLRKKIREGDDQDAFATAKAIYTNGIIPSLAELKGGISGDPWPALYAAFVLRVGGRAKDALVYSEAILKEHPGTSEALMEKAEALYADGGPEQLQDAFAIFKQLRVGSQRGSRMWWQSELRQLEILEKMEQQLDAIGPRIKRLRKENSDLGGGGVRRGLEALQLRMGRRALENS